ncbi:MAG TPA: hypothetical protein VFT98_15805 [Myxococcota bacterium]|nr:hypothetical protein [Myxococcota bacterium]
MADLPNAYAPPAAELIDPAPARSAFFAVSPLKLVVMSTATFGIYEIWWSYQNWRVYKSRGEKLNAALRGFFANFTNFALFGRLRDEAARVGVAVSFAPTAWALAYFLLVLMWRLPDPAGTVIGFFSCVPLLAANSVTLRLNGRLTPELPISAPWAPLDVAGALLGLGLWSFAIWAAFFPEP